MACSLQVSYVNQFLTTVTDFYRLPENKGIEMLREMTDFLDQILEAQSRVYSTPEKNLTFKAIQHLSTAVNSAGPKTRAVANSINQLAPFVNWKQTKGYEVLGEDYMQNYCYYTLIGPNLLINHPALKLGFGIWSPGMHYPLHYHAAEECYHVLGGQIQFRRQSEQWQEYSDSDAIYNSPFEIHELKSMDQPMFLLYTWRGDVAPDAVLL